MNRNMPKPVSRLLEVIKHYQYTHVAIEEHQAVLSKMGKRRDGDLVIDKRYLECFLDIEVYDLCIILSVGRRVLTQLRVWYGFARWPAVYLLSTFSHGRGYVVFRRLRLYHLMKDSHPAAAERLRKAQLVAESTYGAWERAHLPTLETPAEELQLSISCRVCFFKFIMEKTVRPNVVELRGLVFDSREEALDSSAVVMARRADPVPTVAQRMIRLAREKEAAHPPPLQALEKLVAYPPALQAQENMRAPGYTFLPASEDVELAAGGGGCSLDLDLSSESEACDFAAGGDFVRFEQTELGGQQEAAAFQPFFGFELDDAALDGLVEALEGLEEAL